MDEQAKEIVLILGSAPSAVESQSWPKASFTSIVAINNAWRVRKDWDYLIVPDDFPTSHLPPAPEPEQRVIRSGDYVEANNAYGGVVYAGGTMAYSAGYWALARLRPRILAFYGCDMIYPRQGPTHFYGAGTADPLRDDATLRDLEAKSARLMLHAARQGCACVRLSDGPSRLVFPSVSRTDLTEVKPLGPGAGGALFADACAMEEDLGYYVDCGRYWLEEHRLSKPAIDKLDHLWRRAAGLEMASARGDGPRHATA
ncbi:MAG: hypothetical protein AAFO72_05090 [Pseudomonadota bacterium]